jgi:hypothetical protein
MMDKKIDKNKETDEIMNKVMNKRMDEHGVVKDEKMEIKFQEWLNRTIRKIRLTSLTKLEITIHRNCFYTAYMCGMKEVMKTIKK